ncbi:MAG TPA: serine hydrolase domain-containing protein [Verrucomicrobiae bacterium]|nr:serine hydrolase domain-containing protein [Verrucomicrobiae bacterium]
MTRSTYWRRVFAVALILCTAACSSVPSPSTWIDASTTKRIDAVFAAYDHRSSPGFGVALIHDGQLVFARGYGSANLDYQTPITADTEFHLASLSKQFTAAAIALLILDKKLSMDDPVAKYIPEVSKYGPDLRVRDLVYMTSGLHEYFDTPRKNHDPWFTAYYFTRDEAIASALTPRRLLFQPGTQYDYSNTNFMLLTRIVERVTGEPFALFMKTQIFQPLGMTETLINDDSTEVIPNRATGYAPRDAQTISQLKSVGVFARRGPGWIMLARNSPHFGGSGVFSSLRDLAKWDEDWYTGRLAGPSFPKLMNYRERFAFGAMDGMGLGFHSAYGHATINYSGADIDSSTFMERFPEQHFTIVCLSNDPLGNAESKADEVLAILHQSGKI